MAFTLFSLLAFSAVGVLAEQHTIRFQNNCGRGTPTLIKGGDILSTGQDYISNGPLSSAIAYLQTGECLFNGEHCQLIELNMNNPSCPGCGSFADLSLIPSHAFNVAASFAFFGGTNGSCDGLGAVCSDANCDTAYHQSNDNQVVKGCQADNVGLLITFCPSKATAFTNAVPGSLSGGSAPVPVSAAPSSSKASPSTSAIVSIVSSTAVSVALTSSIKAAPSSVIDGVHSSSAVSSAAAHTGASVSSVVAPSSTAVAHTQASQSLIPSASPVSPAHPSSIAVPPAATATVTVTVTVGGCSSVPSASPANVADDGSAAPAPSASPADGSTDATSTSPVDDNNGASAAATPSVTSIDADAPSAAPAKAGAESPTSTVAPSSKTCMRKRSYSGALSHARSRARARAFDSYSHL